MTEQVKQSSNCHLKIHAYSILKLGLFFWKRPINFLVLRARRDRLPTAGSLRHSSLTKSTFCTWNFGKWLQPSTRLQKLAARHLQSVAKHLVTRLFASREVTGLPPPPGIAPAFCAVVKGGASIPAAGSGSGGRFWVGGTQRSPRARPGRPWAPPPCGSGATGEGATRPPALPPLKPVPKEKVTRGWGNGDSSGKLSPAAGDTEGRQPAGWQLPTASAAAQRREPRRVPLACSPPRQPWSSVRRSHTSSEAPSCTPAPRRPWRSFTDTCWGWTRAGRWARGRDKTHCGGARGFPSRRPVPLRSTRAGVLRCPLPAGDPLGRGENDPLWSQSADRGKPIGSLEG